MHIGCDYKVSQTGLFADSLHFDNVKAVCWLARDAKARPSTLRVNPQVQNKSWRQAVATLGRPHCQECFGSATAKKILTVGPPQCSYGLPPRLLLDLRIHSERGQQDRVLVEMVPLLTLLVQNRITLISAPRGDLRAARGHSMRRRKGFSETIFLKRFSETIFAGHDVCLEHARLRQIRMLVDGGRQHQGEPVHRRRPVHRHRGVQALQPQPVWRL